MLFIIILSQIMEVARALRTEIGADCCQLAVQGYISCKIQHDEQRPHYTVPKTKVVSGLGFGLITYECDLHETGYIIPEFDSMKCFECFAEEKHPENSGAYEQQAVLFRSEAISRILFAAFVVGFVFKCVYKTLEEKNNEHSSTNAAKIVPSLQSLKHSVFIKETPEHKADEVPSSVSEPAVRYNLTTLNIKLTTLNNKNAMVSLLTVILLFKNVVCNVSHVAIESLHAKNTSYEFSGSSAQTPPFTLQVGKHIYLTASNGEQVSMQVLEILSRSRYELIYYTSEYITHEPAIGSACCDVNEDCHLRPQTSCYESAFSEMHSKTSALPLNSTIHDNCFISIQTGLEMRCMLVEGKERKGKLYGVYRKTGNVGTVKLSVNIGGNGSQVLKLNPYDSTYQLRGFKFGELNNVPITILHVYDDTLFYLLSYENGFYYVDGSNLGEPKNGMIGDLQISLDRVEENYASRLDERICTESESPCICNCSVPHTESMIRTFKRKTTDFTQPSQYVARKDDLSVIDVFEPFDKGTVQMQLGNRSIRYLSIPDAECNVEFVTSYGCSHCNESAYILFRALDIKKEGLIGFFSNCSFDRQTVKCDYEPTKLILEENYQTCSIQLYSKDKPFNISIKYNVGRHFKPETNQTVGPPPQNSENWIKHFVTNNIFIKTLVVAVILCFVFGLIVTVVLLVVRLRKREYCIEKNETTEVNLVDL